MTERNSSSTKLEREEESVDSAANTGRTLATGLSQAEVEAQTDVGGKGSVAVFALTTMTRQSVDVLSSAKMTKQSVEGDTSALRTRRPQTEVEATSHTRTGRGFLSEFSMVENWLKSRDGTISCPRCSTRSSMGEFIQKRRELFACPSSLGGRICKQVEIISSAYPERDTSREWPGHINWSWVWKKMNKSSKQYPRDKVTCFARKHRSYNVGEKFITNTSVRTHARLNNENDDSL